MHTDPYRKYRWLWMKNTDTEIPVSKKVGTHHYCLLLPHHIHKIINRKFVIKQRSRLLEALVASNRTHSEVTNVKHFSSYNINQVGGPNISALGWGCYVTNPSPPWLGMLRNIPSQVVVP